MDQAIHKLNVGHYTLDVKVSQLLDRLVRLEGKVADVEDSVHDVSNFCKDNRREIGRLEGLVPGDCRLFPFNASRSLTFPFSDRLR